MRRACSGPVHLASASCSTLAAIHAITRTYGNDPAIEENGGAAAAPEADPDAQDTRDGGRGEGYAAATAQGDRLFCGRRGVIRAVDRRGSRDSRIVASARDLHRRREHQQ
jgi:hypothetical protein